MISPPVDIVLQASNHKMCAYIVVLINGICAHLTLTQQELTKAQLFNMKKIVRLRHHQYIGLYGYRNAGQAVSQVWFAMGNHGFGVREVPGSNPGGEPPFLKVSVSNEIG